MDQITNATDDFTLKVIVVVFFVAVVIAQSVYRHAKRRAKRPTESTESTKADEDSSDE